MEMDKQVVLTFIGVDDWGRAVFKGEGERYYGVLSELFDEDATVIDVLRSGITEGDLYYFGTYFGCEPYGDTMPSNLVLPEPPYSEFKG